MNKTEIDTLKTVKEGGVERTATNWLYAGETPPDKMLRVLRQMIKTGFLTLVPGPNHPHRRVVLSADGLKALTLAERNGTDES